MSNSDMNMKTGIRDMESKLLSGARAPLLTTLLVATAISLAACGKGEKPELPPYANSEEIRFMGSLYYAQNGCANCHGAEWDGTGPEGRLLARDGVNPPTNFVEDVPGDRSPYDYFIAMTDPNSYFADSIEAVTPGPQREAVLSFTRSHSWHNFTDKGRWAMAHFLFSLAPESTERVATARAGMEQAKADYAGRRRLERGYTPIAEREGSPDLSQLKAGLTLDRMPTQGEVTAERAAISREHGAGALLYRNQCSTCHGAAAEGSHMVRRLGLLDNATDHEMTHDGIRRGVPVLIATGDLRGASALNSLESFRSAHTGRPDMIAPSFRSYSSTEWQELYDYTKRLAGN